MDSLIQADIFFFIATIALALIAFGVAVVIFYVIRIVRDMRDIAAIVKTESRHLASDLEALRANARRGMTLAGIMGLFKSIGKRARRSKKSALTNDKE